jgi:bacillithiol biosynthesis cysteine-adding enzyme BshC
MPAESLSYASTLPLPKAIQALLDQHPSVARFIDDFATPQAFERRIATLDHPAERRRLLSERLLSQHKNSSPKVIANCKRLAEASTYTVTTGHQLNLFGGPAFFVYKIAHTIAMAKALEAQHPGVHIVPLFWMASEDHDIAEINHVQGKNALHLWENAGSGAAGRLSLTTLGTVTEEFLNDLPDDGAPWHDLLKQYAQCTTLADATRLMVDALFGDYGVVALDADDRELKRAFAPVMRRELEQRLAKPAVDQATAELTQLGFLAPVSPREVNLFYLSEGQRDGILFEGHRYVAGSALNADLNEAIALMDAHPERFSPNVVMRPVYQEFLLPNLAYIGGAGEMSYWLQLKDVFEALEVRFPLLLPRNGAVVFNERESGLLDTLGYSVADAFTDLDELKRAYVLGDDASDQVLAEAANGLLSIYSSIDAHLTAIDGSLHQRVQASLAKQIKELEQLEKSAFRARKQQNEVAMKRIERLHESVFPKGRFQERYRSFFELDRYVGHKLIQHCVAHFDPFEPSLHAFRSKG